eukprot:747063-Rhodomonas_salina.1
MPLLCDVRSGTQCVPAPRLQVSEPLLTNAALPFMDAVLPSMDAMAFVYERNVPSGDAAIYRGYSTIS